jgi:hypothetical protein
VAGFSWFLLVQREFLVNGSARVRIGLAKVKYYQTPRGIVGDKFLEIKKVPGVPECYFIENFLTKDECESFISLAQTSGFEKKKSRRSGPAIRNNQRLVYIADEETTSKLERRIAPLAAEIDLSAIGPGWRLAKKNFINPKWRFNLYLPGEEFHPHFDSGYAFRPDHRSLLSLIIYLNDDFEGGETVFYPDGQSRDNMLPQIVPSLWTS